MTAIVPTEVPKDMLQVRTSRPLKLKDKPMRRQVHFNFMRDFGFIPEEILISKVYGDNNTFQLHVVLTPDQLQKEAKIKKEKELQAEIEKAKDKPLD